ncbi:alpha-amylase family glycosyl hydrolase [Alteromonas macleodii]|uniref:alpha-amylase family glycosyl hydrolase n=1 Tax=Alteromonas macleodii TaxID=28108 RepID=UPI0006923F93|nr:alpha-amylase family glycosyl hydrolase [Alteromonas macleodii]
MELPANDEWWRGAVIYQIYPRSFKDSSGSGTGDLRGIIDKITYLKRLNIDAIWLSPVFPSPMKDFGYDISDYLNIDSSFGTLEDFKELVKQAHANDIKIIIDQVLSHTSDAHEWFKQSKTSRTNDKADWYVWADPREDGTAPNNWLSFFGGSAWTYDTNRQQYYFHNFLSSQPDLNYHNKEVQSAVLDVLQFWLDLGVDGFRLDTVNMYFCDSNLRSNPPRKSKAPIQGMNCSNPRARQEQLYNVNRPENVVFLEKVRALLDKYHERTSLGEIGSVEDTIGMMADYTSGNSRLHMCYTADLLAEHKSASFVYEIIKKTEQRISTGWPCWSLGNHDSVRFATRWGAHEKDKIAFNKAMLGMLFTLRGSVCVYQGEELGYEEAELDYDEIVDPFGKAFWPDYKGRDGCRTPIAWEGTPSGNFSSANNTWLPMAKQHLSTAVCIQEKNKNSILNFVRDFLAFRSKNRELISGNIHLLSHQNNVLIFERSLGQDVSLVAINMSGDEARFSYPERYSVENCIWGQETAFNSRILEPWQLVIAKIKNRIVG